MQENKIVARGGYHTRQRERLLAYLESMEGTHFTVSDICDHFRAVGDAIGTTTVYRQVERMVDEGLVQKYHIDANTPACFEYIGKKQSADPVSCFHCKCEKCGALIHLHCDEIAAFKEHLSEHHRFELDPVRTVFYGICEHCRMAG
ncbi:MAG: transcriptional repressor [Lachnospiraceae bacterium]|nr:transcriptional repressor [Lachnospiraceae bacterium]